MPLLSHRFLLVPVIALGLGQLACTTETEPPEDAPPFGDQQGQLGGGAEPDYPQVVGWEVGRAVPNFAWVGYSNFVNPPFEGMQFIQMSDFYNPTGDGVYPEGSPFGAGNPKPKAIFLDMSATWCPPCKYQSGQIMPEKYAELKPKGAEFITSLVEAGTQLNPQPMTYEKLGSWAATYATDYPLVMDNERQVQPLFEPSFPSNMLIRTSDMKMLVRVAGAVDPGSAAGANFWNKFEQVLDGTYQE